MEENPIRNYLLDNKELEGYTIGKTKVIIKRWLPKGGGEVFFKREERPTGVFTLSLNGNDGPNTYSQRERLEVFKSNLSNYNMGAEPKGILKSILKLGEYNEKPKGQKSVLSALARGLEFDEKIEMGFTEIYDKEGKSVGKIEGDIIGAHRSSELCEVLEEDIQFFKKKPSGNAYVLFEFEPDFGETVSRYLEDMNKEENKERGRN